MSDQAASPEGASLVSDMRPPPRYGALLALIVVTFVFLSAAPSGTWTGLVALILQMGIVAAATSATRMRPLLTRVTHVVVFLTLIAAVAIILVTDGTRAQAEGRGTAWALAAFLVMFAPVVVGLGVVDDLRARGVTVQAVMGALCVYLLVGFFFASAYGAVARIGGDAFFVNGTDGDMQIHLYFSIVTLTTLGYGDYAPAADLGRTLATVQALVGQIYLVTVIAVLVSNMGRGARPGRR